MFKVFGGKGQGAWSKGLGAWGKGQEVSLSALISLRPFIFYSLAPCTLLLAPFETEQAELAKVELLIIM